ncbi:sodium/hydrogen exchanger [Thermovibrio ammonificans HB-1]|uniref:Sodium/hydrogen exchanger n=1 Tax=Thermovibrio ammonificans (strain DSM 15698 / JCM 12110 / HB-1) TaxID=648996 RepID=E8T577_THEA1|nr:cation:proton antiporter [Thermovibrio ammonificans]ADU96415.1 sodium/hydrogen exchanger [Thermovibrio ammonificans HB-1]
MENSLLAIILIAVGILFVPFLSRVLRIPVSVGEILYGVVIGKSLLNLVHHSQWLNFLSTFGFLLLMFIAGLEVKLKEIASLPLKTRLLYTVIPVLVFTVAFAGTHWLKLNALTAIAIGAISVGIVVSVLREKGLLSTRYGKTVFLVGIVGEVISIALLTLFSLYTEFGFSSGFWLGLLKLGVYLLVARILLVFLKSIVWWFPNKFKFFFEKNPSEIGVRISLAVMFMLSVAASLINLEPIIGAFISGVIFATVFEETENIEEKLSGISFGFLIPIFFIYVGINFKMPHLSLHLLQLLGVLVALSFTAKILPSLLLKLEGFTLRESVGAGALLSAPLTLVIVTAELGTKLKVIDHHTENLLILLAIVTGILAPVLFNLLVKGEGSESSNS